MGYGGASGPSSLPKTVPSSPGMGLWVTSSVATAPSGISNGSRESFQLDKRSHLYTKLKGSIKGGRSARGAGAGSKVTLVTRKIQIGLEGDLIHRRGGGGGGGGGGGVGGGRKSFSAKAGNNAKLTLSMPGRSAQGSRLSYQPGATTFTAGSAGGNKSFYTMGGKTLKGVSRLQRRWESSGKR